MVAHTDSDIDGAPLGASDDDDAALREKELKAMRRAAYMRMSRSIQRHLPTIY